MMLKHKVEDNIVYLAAPKRLFTNVLYNKAEKYICSLKPFAVMRASKLFTSNEQWLKTYKNHIANCEVMVIVTDNGIVGKGVYLEYSEFRKHHKLILWYVERGKTKSLLVVRMLEVLNEDNWIDYAKIRT